MKLGRPSASSWAPTSATTVTAQLLSLDISSDNPLLMLLKPARSDPAAVGILFHMFIKGGHKQTVGQIVLGWNS